MIKIIADRMVYGGDTDWAMNIESFDWIPAVGIYGIYNTYKYTNEKKYLDFLIGWADRHLQNAYNQKTVNSTAPLLTIIELYKITKNEQYLNICIDIAEWILNEAPLTREGGLEHTVTEAGPGFSEQIWADTLFMVCLFLVKLGNVINNQKYINFATNQLVIHYNALQDKNTFLCYHGWSCNQKNHMSGVYWARANAWIVYSSTIILSETGDFEERSFVLDCLQKHINALSNVQHTNGMFSTVLDDNTSYEELSASAGIVCGIKKAIDFGYADKNHIKSFHLFIDNYKKFVDEKGNVLNVSTGTPVMPTKQAYKTVPICPTLYGQGIMLLALCESKNPIKIII